MMLSVVIPAYNEEATLQAALEQVVAVLQGEGAGLDYEVIVVDDGSRDATWALLQRMASLDGWGRRLRGLRFSRNFGKEAAIFAGLKAARGDAVILMDADLQHPPAVLLEMLVLWSQGSYLVVECVKRRRQRESVLRRLAAVSFYRLLLLGAGLDLRGSMDFKLLDRRAVDAYLELPERGRFFRGLTAWVGLPTARVEIEIPERSAGATRWRLGRLLEFARRNIISFTELPLHLISWIGAAGLLLSLVLTLQTLWNKWFGSSDAGFPTVIILILFMGSLILVSLGIIGEYLAELYQEIKKRPLFVVRETLGAPTGVPEDDRHRG